MLVRYFGVRRRKGAARDPIVIVVVLRGHGGVWFLGNIFRSEVRGFGGGVGLENDGRMGRGFNEVVYRYPSTLKSS